MSKEYTPDIFINNFLEDRYYLGDDAQILYEGIFSIIMGKKVHLDSFVEEIDYALEDDRFDIMESLPMELGEENLEDIDYLLSEGLFSTIRDKYNSIFNPLGLEHNFFGAITPKSFQKTAKIMDPEVRAKNLEKLANQNIGFFTRLKNKIYSFFGQFEGMSFTEVLDKGLAWLTKPENMSNVLGTAGGVALMVMVLKILKKKKKEREYNKLMKAAANSNLKEELEEMDNNNLKNALLLRERHDDYFGY